MQHEQTEIDALAALRPEVLRDIALEAIEPFYDPTLAERTQEAEREIGEHSAKHLLNNGVGFQIENKGIMHRQSPPRARDMKLYLYEASKEKSSFPIFPLLLILLSHTLYFVLVSSDPKNKASVFPFRCSFRK
jgi:hypothetical protein